MNRFPDSRVSVLVLFIFVHLTVKARCEVYRSLHWTPDNSVFMSNSSGCVDGEAPQMNVLPSSTIHVICPTPVTVLETVQSIKAKQNLFENLWIVYDNKSFETCNVNRSNSQLLKKKNRQLVQCDKPLELKYFPIVFQQFSAVPGGLEFTPGNTYYFLATSDGTEGSLNDTSGGHCNDTENGVSMKFKVYVCTNETDPKCTQGNTELGKLYCDKSRPTPSKLTAVPYTQAVNQTAHVNTNVNSLSPSHPCPSILLTQVVTVCSEDLATTCPCSPFTPSATSPQTRVTVSNSDVLPTESKSKRLLQQASGKSKEKDTWMPLALFFICSCVILLLAFGVYMKFFKKQVNQVNPSAGTVAVVA